MEHHNIPAPVFRGFAHKADELSDYISKGNIFKIYVAAKNIVSTFVAPDAGAFRAWLTAHSKTDRTDETGSLILDYYFGNTEFKNKKPKFKSKKKGDLANFRLETPNSI